MKLDHAEWTCLPRGVPAAAPASLSRPVLADEDAAGAPADRPLPRRRRRARRRPRRRAAGAGGAAHPGRLHRRHQHRLDHRRPLRQRLLAAGTRQRPRPTSTGRRSSRTRRRATRSSYRRKEEDRWPHFGFEFGVDAGGLRTASGLIAGQKLNFLLRQLTLHTTGVHDFDDLAIPYRAVAADLDDGSMVVLDHGALADAMRASMAIPGAFTPYEIDGRRLVDGGMVRNLPYDVVKSMGADVVIAVDVGTPVGKLARDPGFLARRLAHARPGDQGQRRHLARRVHRPQDLLMVPDLEGVTMASFPLMADAADRGESRARAQPRATAPLLGVRGRVRRLARASARRPPGAADRGRRRVRARRAIASIPGASRRACKTQPDAPLDVGRPARRPACASTGIGEFELGGLPPRAAARRPRVRPGHRRPARSRGARTTCASAWP